MHGRTDGSAGTEIANRHVRQARLGLVAAISAIAGSVLGIEPAYANNDWGTNPDNKTHDVEKLSLGSNANSAVDHGKSELNRSELTTTSNSNDVHVEDWWRADGWYGVTWCSTDAYPPAGGKCDHFWVEFNLRTTSRDNFSSTNWKKLGCHELGHTGGLHEQTDISGHPNSCMRQGKLEKISLDSHDISTINADV